MGCPINFSSINKNVEIVKLNGMIGVRTPISRLCVYEFMMVLSSHISIKTKNKKNKKQKKIVWGLN